MFLRFAGTRFAAATRSKSSFTLYYKVLDKRHLQAYIPNMPSGSPLRARPTEPIPIDARAADHLRYIRETMERASEFTAVPGWGGVATGLTAIAAALIAARQHSERSWLIVWLLEAFVAVAVTAPSAATKARRINSKLLSGPGRKFFLSFAPPILVGGLLTLVLAHLNMYAVLPGVWLLLYGTAVVTGGAFSVRIVPVMGMCLMALGAMALISPQRMGDLYMALGFGVVQIGFGLWIAQNHGG